MKVQHAGRFRSVGGGVRLPQPPKRERRETALHQSALLIAFECELSGKERLGMSRHDFGVPVHDDPNEGRTRGSDRRKR